MKPFSACLLHYSLQEDKSLPARNLSQLQLTIVHILLIGGSFAVFKSHLQNVNLIKIWSIENDIRSSYAMLESL